MTFLEAVASEAFSPVILMLGAFAKCSALFIIISAILNLKKYAIEGDHSDQSPGRVVATLAVATLLWNVDQFLMDWQQTVFGQQYGYPLGNPLGYSYGGNSVVEKFASAKRAVVLFVKVWGYFSFIRGLHIWYQTTLGQKNSSFWKGFFHCLGGVIAVNFDIFSEVVLDFLIDLNPLR